MTETDDTIDRDMNLLLRGGPLTQVAEQARANALAIHQARLRQVFMQASREFTGCTWTIDDDKALDDATEWLRNLSRRS